MRIFSSRSLLPAVCALASVIPASSASALQRNPDDRVVCRRDETVGSRLGQRTCLTRAQWRDRDQQQREVNRGIIDGTERDNRGDIAGPIQGQDPR